MTIQVKPLHMKPAITKAATFRGYLHSSFTARRPCWDVDDDDGVMVYPYSYEYEYEYEYQYPYS